MRLAPSVLALLFLAACGDAAIKVDDTGTGDTSGDTGTDTSDTSDTNDTDTDDTVDTTSPWAGTYQGTVAISIEGGDGGDGGGGGGGGGLMPICTGTAELTVNDAGALVGEGTCAPGDGPGAATVVLTGTVAAEGAATGNVEQTSPDGATTSTYALSGAFDTSGFALEWSGELTTPRGDQIAFVGTVSSAR